MSLLLLRTEPATLQSTWSIEAPTVGVVLIDVTIRRAESAAPLHWRAGAWTKPPLDVSLDDEGRLISIQFVLQDERVSPGQWSVLPDPEGAAPVFDVKNWPAERYRDETLAVTASRLSGGELALRIGDEQHLARACRVDAGLLMAFGADGDLAKILLGPLANEDWEGIDAFSFVE